MSKELNIGFTGDLSFSGYFAGCEGDDALFDAGIRSFFDQNDYNVINFESPVTPCRIPTKTRLTHRCGDEALEFVKRNIKSPVLSFANNHMMDFGYIGVIDTMEACERAQLPCIGIGLDLNGACRFTVLGDEVKVAVLAVEYKKYLIASENAGGPLHESKTAEIKAAITEMKKAADYAVIVYHGGDEFLNAPMPYIRRQLHQYIKWGANAVVAHHPHVVQGYEVLDSKHLIVYSLGNFIFDTDYQRSQENTDRGMLVSLRFTPEGIRLSCLPTEIDRENHKVTAGSDLRFFTDVSENYTRLWTREAARKQDTKDRAKRLKDTELAEKELKFASERARVDALEAAAELKRASFEKPAEPAEEDPDDAPHKTKGSSFHSLAKRAYKRLIVKRKDNVRAVVLRAGAALGRIYK